MDLTLVDVTELAEVQPGDEVILFGGGRSEAPSRDSDSGYAATLATALAAVEGPGDQSPAAPGFITVEEVADWAGTIPHEILSRIGPRVPRIVVGGAGTRAAGSAREPR